MHLPLGKHLIETRKGFRRTGKDNQTGYGTVETVDDTKKHGARLLVLFFQVLLDGFRQRFVASLVTLHNLAALLRDDDDVVVLVDYLHRF